MILSYLNLLFAVLFLQINLFEPNPDKDAPKRISQQEYIQNYKIVAIQDMLITGVPASITLAQASLESDNGNSPLAINARNHFGIKCHDWKGDKYYHDDDAKQECFRKYDTALESFDDHSYFLKNRKRYAFLFEIPRTDYKAWAYGLKKAGYATNPVYAEKLIDIIERNNLQELDKYTEVPKEEKLAKLEKKKIESSTISNKKLEVPKQGIQFNNGIKYVIVGKGGSFEDIISEQDVRMWQIRKYNDLPKNSKAVTGQKIYLQPKRRKCKEEFHTLEAGESMYTVSQRYGVKLKLLYKRNRMKPGEPAKPGQRLWLRKKKKDD